MVSLISGNYKMKSRARQSLISFTIPPPPQKKTPKNSACAGQPIRFSNMNYLKQYFLRKGCLSMYLSAFPEAQLRIINLDKYLNSVFHYVPNAVSSVSVQSVYVSNPWMYPRKNTEPVQASLYPQCLLLSLSNPPSKYMLK